MKIALTTNVVAIPPTYFVVNHAQRLAKRHEFELFALLADVRDPSVTIPVHDFAPLRHHSASSRTVLAPFAGPAMARALKKFGPDLIHQHFATWSSPAISVAKRGNLPLLATLHGYDVRVLSRRPVSALDVWHRRNVRATQVGSNRVLAVSEYLADQAVAVGFDARRLNVHYQGIDTAFFTPLSDPHFGGEAPVISFVGAFDMHKGPLDLVHASLKLIDKFDHQLQLMGSGPLERQLREIAGRFPHIEVLGRVERNHVRDVLQHSAAMVLPSRHHKGGAEAAGLVLLEAQACGTPVIAYDTGGISEMMVADSTGFLVTEGDTTELTQAIRTVLTLSSSDRADLGRVARQFVETQRSLTHSCMELDQHYQDLAGGI